MWLPQRCDFHRFWFIPNSSLSIFFGACHSQLVDFGPERPQPVLFHTSSNIWPVASCFVSYHFSIMFPLLPFNLPISGCLNHLKSIYLGKNNPKMDSISIPIPIPFHLTKHIHIHIFIYTTYSWLLFHTPQRKGEALGARKPQARAQHGPRGGPRRRWGAGRPDRGRQCAGHAGGTR